MKKLFIQTYGCQMNEADSMRAAALLSHQYERTTVLEEADLIIVNTCSVREKPERKLYSDLGRFNQIKKDKPSTLIGAMGCVAQQKKDEIFKKAPYTDIIIGPDGIDDLPVLVEKASRGERSRSADLKRRPSSLTTAVTPVINAPSAYVTVMKGCDKFCSFCIVPFTRGREASRAPQTVIEEVQALARQGVIEVTLLGQNVTGYGKDLDPKIGLPDLVKMIIEKVPEIERIRFLTSHPNDTDEATLELFALKKVCPYLHLPIQSGSDRILSAMSRNYTVADYMEKINYVRKVAPKIALASDFIVGFPGETRQDFEATMALLKEVRYDGIYSFAYSKRPFTKAAKLEDKQPREEKLAWLAELQKLQAEIQKEKFEETIGTEQEVLIEGRSVKSESELTGRTPCNKPVNAPLPPDCIGKIVKLKIAGAAKNSLRGEPV